MGIIENYDFWRDSVLALVIASITLSYLGVWASLKKVVYQPLAISQISSLGVILIFFINEKFKLSIASEIGAIVLALLMSFYFSSRKSGAREAEVYLYIFASALIFLLGNFIRQDLHDIQSILFGDSVLIEFKQIIYLLIASVLVFIIYILFYKKFLYISFDRDGSAASGFNAYKYNVIIYMSFAIIISISSNTIGALPTFGIMIIPALSSLNMVKSMRMAFTLAIFISLFSSISGYFLAFTKELPVGATIVAISSTIYLITLIFKKNS